MEEKKFDLDDPPVYNESFGLDLDFDQYKKPAEVAHDEIIEIRDMTRILADRLTKEFLIAVDDSYESCHAMTIEEFFKKMAKELTTGFAKNDLDSYMERKKEELKQSLLNDVRYDNQLRETMKSKALEAVKESSNLESILTEYLGLLKDKIKNKRLSNVNSYPNKDKYILTIDPGFSNVTTMLDTLNIKNMPFIFPPPSIGFSIKSYTINDSVKDTMTLQWEADDQTKVYTYLTVNLTECHAKRIRLHMGAGKNSYKNNQIIILQVPYSSNGNFIYLEMSVRARGYSSDVTGSGRSTKLVVLSNTASTITQIANQSSHNTLVFLTSDTTYYSNIQIILHGWYVIRFQSSSAPPILVKV